jgi:CRISPR-associated endonuclease/helicase Cas3
VFDEPLAHITEDGRIHPLREHLFKTAERAADFASVFGFREWGWLGGLWHDLGKYAPAFQDKIRAATGEEAHLEAKVRVDHSTAGGLHSVERFGMAGRLLAYIAAGHHAGLPDWEADRKGRAALSQRLLKKKLFDAALPFDMLAKLVGTRSQRNNLSAVIRASGYACSFRA